MDMKAKWQERRELVEAQLPRELRRDEPLDATLCASMEYSLMAGGKRLRPILLMAAADAVGGRGEDFLTTGCEIGRAHV